MHGAEIMYYLRFGVVWINLYLDNVSHVAEELFHLLRRGSR